MIRKIDAKIDTTQRTQEDIKGRTVKGY